MTQRSITRLVAAFLMNLMLASCAKEQDSPAYQAACQGPPLRTTERRNKADEDGYFVNRLYDCIDKTSFEEVEEQRAKWKAAHTPEALAQREAELAERAARAAEDRARLTEERVRNEAAEKSAALEVLQNIALRNIDVNTATEADIAGVISISPKVAAQIIEERNKQRFKDWTDLIHRVTGLSAAQTALFASICGLNVDGKSLDGAPPNAAMAASISKKYQQYQKK